MAIFLAWLAGVLTAVAVARTTVAVVAWWWRRKLEVAIASRPKPSDEDVRRAQARTEVMARLQVLLVRFWELPDDTSPEAVVAMWRESREIRRDLEQIDGGHGEKAKQNEGM